MHFSADHITNPRLHVKWILWDNYITVLFWGFLHTINIPWSKGWPIWGKMFRFISARPHSFLPITFKSQKFQNWFPKYNLQFKNICKHTKKLKRGCTISKVNQVSRASTQTFHGWVTIFTNNWEKQISRKSFQRSMEDKPF